MKIAYVMPHSYEHLYSNELDRFSDPDDLDRKILRNKDDYEDRYCGVTHAIGMQTTYYYLSCVAREPREFRHKYGHKMKKIPITVSLRKYGWEYSHSLLTEIMKDDPDLVFVFTYILNRIFPDMYDALALYCRRNGYPFVARHGGSTIAKLFPGRRWIKKVTLNLADRVIVPSKEEFFLLRKNFALKENKLVNLANPVDLANFYEMQKEVACRNLNKDPMKKYILYVGRLDRRKGIHQILDVLPKIVRKTEEEISFLIVGYGPHLDALRQLTAKRNLQKYVSFEGLVFHNSLKFYYNLADVFVLPYSPSYSFGIPNVLMEALACNTPCVGTNTSGIREIISDNVGIVFSNGNKNELFYAIKKILNGDFEINQAKRKDLLDDWSVENFGHKLSQLFTEILNGNG